MEKVIDPEEIEFNSSDSEDDEGHQGHPVESKNDVLCKLKDHFPYHKNGPAQPYSWTDSEVKIMSQHLQDYADKIQEGKRRKIRAVHYDGKPYVGGLLKFVNKAITGKLFPQNPHIRLRKRKYCAGELSQHQLWHIASEILIAEFDYWIDVSKENAKHVANGQPERCRYPHINKLVFRNNEDFVGGLWSDFETHWQRFIDELRYLLF